MNTSSRSDQALSIELNGEQDAPASQTNLHLPMKEMEYIKKKLNQIEPIKKTIFNLKICVCNNKDIHK